MIFHRNRYRATRGMRDFVFENWVAGWKRYRYPQEHGDDFQLYRE